MTPQEQFAALPLGQRIAAVIATAIFSAVVGAVVLFGAAWVFSGTVETIAKYSEERDRCLKQATNGYEIRQCSRN